MMLYVKTQYLLPFCSSSFSERHVNETVDKINTFVQEGRPIPEEYSFMNHLLASKGLSRKDITILTLSLFLDGLSTVSSYILSYACNVDISLYATPHDMVERKMLYSLKDVNLAGFACQSELLICP